MTPFSVVDVWFLIKLYILLEFKISESARVGCRVLCIHELFVIHFLFTSPDI